MKNTTGTIQSLEVRRKIDTGYVLEGDILLHKNETETELEEGEVVEVFLYQNKKGQIVASTQIPAIQMGMFGWAVVTKVLPDLGVFVNIGTSKDILVSRDDLPIFEGVWPIAADKLYVTLDKDKKGRLLAVPATEETVASEYETAPEELLNESVSGYIYRSGKEGAACITEKGYRGFIHFSEQKQEPRLGEKVTGRVIKVKEDGTINVSLRPLKKHSRGEDAETILAHLEANDGMMSFSDKSDPEEIRKTFHISKSAFKRALGKLMKEGKVKQQDGKTYLVNK